MAVHVRILSALDQNALLCLLLLPQALAILDSIIQIFIRGENKLKLSPYGFNLPLILSVA